MQSLGYELFDIIPRRSPIQKIVSMSKTGKFEVFGADTASRCTDVMRYFVDKFPEGYEGWAKERGEEPLTRDYLKPF